MRDQDFQSPTSRSKCSPPTPSGLCLVEVDPPCLLNLLAFDSSVPSSGISLSQLPIPPGQALLFLQSGYQRLYLFCETFPNSLPSSWNILSLPSRTPEHFMPLKANDSQSVTIIYVLNIYYGMSAFIIPFNSHNYLGRH